VVTEGGQGGRPPLDLLIPLGIAAALSAYRIGVPSLWADEAFSVALVRLGWAPMWDAILADEANMAPFYVLLRQWLHIGSSEAAVRSLSALCVVAAVLPIYGLGLRLFDRATAGIAALLFAVNAYVIAQGAQEARAYGLVLLCVTISSYLFVRSVERPSPALWVSYVAVSVLAIYTHFFAAGIIGAHLLAALLSRHDRAWWRAVIVSMLAIALLVSPLSLPILAQAQGRLSWIRPPSPMTLVWALVDLVGRGGRLLLVVYALACGLAVVRWGRRGPRRWSVLFLVAWFALPVLGSFLFSIVVRPVFVTRFLIVAVPPLALLAAAGIASLRPVALRTAALLLLLALAGRALHWWYGGRYPKEDWRAAAHDVMARTRPGDAVVFWRPMMRIPFEYYAQGRRESARWPEPLFPSDPWGARGPEGSRPSKDLDDWLARHPVRHPRVWVVLSHEETGSAAPWLPTTLEATSCRIYQRGFTGVRVVLYQLTPCGQAH
jgi:mannosyltransferase